MADFFLHPDQIGGGFYLAPDAAPTPGDTGRPVLSAPTATANGSNAGTGSVTTDEDNGTLYYMASTNATETAATVKTGATQGITSAGAKNVAVNGLAASTLYYLHYLHRDAAGNDSAVANSGSFTTAAPAGVPRATYVQETFESRAGLPWTNLSGMRWYFFDQVWPVPLLAPVAQGAVETTDGVAVGFFDIAGLTSLRPGDVGTLAYSNTNGDPDQADLMSVFTPVYVR